MSQPYFSQNTSLFLSRVGHSSGSSRRVEEFANQRWLLSLSNQEEKRRASDREAQAARVGDDRLGRNCVDAARHVAAAGINAAEFIRQESVLTFVNPVLERAVDFLP